MAWENYILLFNKMYFSHAIKHQNCLTFEV